MAEFDDELIEKLAEAAFRAMVPADGVSFENVAERSREVFRTQARAVLEAITETHAIVPLMNGHEDDDGDGLLWPGISGHPGLYVSTTDPDGRVYDDESSFLPAEAMEIAGQWAAASILAAYSVRGTGEQPRD